MHFNILCGLLVNSLITLMMSATAVETCG